MRRAPLAQAGSYLVISRPSHHARNAPQELGMAPFCGFRTGDGHLEPNAPLAHRPSRSTGTKQPPMMPPMQPAPQLEEEEDGDDGGGDGDGGGGDGDGGGEGEAADGGGEGDAAVQPIPAAIEGSE